MSEPVWSGLDLLNPSSAAAAIALARRAGESLRSKGNQSMLMQMRLQLLALDWVLAFAQVRPGCGRERRCADNDQNPCLTCERWMAAKVVARAWRESCS